MQPLHPDRSAGGPEIDAWTHGDTVCEDPCAEMKRMHAGVSFRNEIGSAAGQLLLDEPSGKNAVAG